MNHRNIWNHYLILINALPTAMTVHVTVSVFYLHLVQLVHSNNMVPSLIIQGIPSFCTWTAVNSILIDTPATTPFF